MSDKAEKLAQLKAQAVKQLKECGCSNPNDSKLDTIVNRFKLIVDNKDAILVSGQDPAELETVRRNFVMKHLGVDDKDKGTAGVQKVADKMSGIRMKNRAAFYYLVQEELG
jgi:hypothetical protein